MEIKINNVKYKDLPKINLELSGNNVTTIVGENSNLLLELLNCNYNHSGKITYNGVVLNKKNKVSIIKNISYVSRKFKNKYSKNTVVEYMNYLIYFNKYSIKNQDKKIKDSLKIVGLKEDYLDRNINTLSTSERKLFQIALALLNNPKLILLEDPFYSLDNNLTKKLIRLFNRLNDKHDISIIITCNNTNLVYKYLKNIILIDKDIIKGESKEIFENKYKDFDKIEIPNIIKFTGKIKNKKIKLDYHRDIRDLIKDIYKHV